MSIVENGVRVASGEGPNTAAASTGVSTTGTAPGFTGTAPVAAETEALSGSGYTTAGQVVTTSDNQTVTANQFAGCWLMFDTHAPCLIVSHPAAAAAPVAFTVRGAAPASTAEGYYVYASPTPVGTVASHTHGITDPTHSHAQV